MAVLRAVRNVTCHTQLRTGRAVASATGGARLCRARPRMTGWTFLQTAVTVGVAIKLFVKANAHLLTTVSTSDQATFTKPLSAAFTGANLRTVLIAAGATDRTTGTDKCCLIFSRIDIVNM